MGPKDSWTIRNIRLYGWPMTGLRININEILAQFIIKLKNKMVFNIQIKVSFLRKE
jgi:hypothetical protein